MLSLVAGPEGIVWVPSFTEETVLLFTPPKNPLPVMLRVVAVKLLPEATLSALITGAGGKTAYLSAGTVVLVPPNAVTVMS